VCMCVYVRACVCMWYACVYVYVCARVYVRVCLCVCVGAHLDVFGSRPELNLMSFLVEVYY